VIGRLWHGWTAAGEDADAYDDYDQPVIEPEAARRLAHYDDRVAHFETVVAPG
jgi:hypothetical protein